MSGARGGDAGREMDERVTALVEPKPEAVSARALRATYRDWQWYSDHMHESPDGWWHAQIGTDHGPQSADDKPVRWRPAREPSTDDAAALLALAATGGRVVITRVHANEWQVQFDGHRGWWGETLAFAICTALLALTDRAEAPSCDPAVTPERDER